MRTRSKKIIVICFSCFLFLWGCEELVRRKIGGLAGSYPFVEYWDLKATETEVLDAIVALKTENQDLQPPNQKELFEPRHVDYDWGSAEMIKHLHLSLKDSTLSLPPMTKTNTKSDYWLYIDFYYADTREIIHTWTRPDFDTTVTTFAFVSLGKIDNPSYKRLINRDFWYLANTKQISKFKATIVDKIQQQIDKRRKSGK